MCGWVMGWVWIWPVVVLVGLVLLGYAATRFVQGREGIVALTESGYG